LTIYKLSVYLKLLCDYNCTKPTKFGCIYVVSPHI